MWFTASPLRLWTHLAVKLVFNTISTTTMAPGADLGTGWCMSHSSNKKLIDRGTRLISQITGVDYASACIVLHEAIYDRSRVEGRQNGQSPVVVAIERIRQSSTRPASAAIFDDAVT